MNKINITTTTESIAVQAPYHATFVARARDLGGKWRAPSWVFDVRDENRIRELCRECYGTDGLTADLCTLRIEWKQSSVVDKAGFVAAGRPVARAFGRDSGAKLDDGVVMLAGGFGSGGSVKNWVTTVDEGTVVLVRDFPRAEAERLVAEQPASRRVYAIEAEAPVVDREALSAERERLLARLAEIDQLLAG